MKKIILLLVFLLNCLIAQLTLANHKDKSNIVNQPVWGPVGYDYVAYYYLPEIETYYSVKKEKYIFLENGNWVSSNSIPARSFGYNLYQGRVIVINEYKPFLRHNYYSSKYSVITIVQKQQIIRDSHEIKYMANKNHPDHLIWL